jgi:hypothetical protein
LAEDAVKWRSVLKMFELLVSSLELILSAFGELAPSDKKRVAKRLVGIYRDITELTEEGSRVLTLMSELAMSEDSSYGGSLVGEFLDDERAPQASQLRQLLVGQEKRIKKLKKALAKERIATMLSIKIPELHPIMVRLVAEKGDVVYFHLTEPSKEEWALRPDPDADILTGIVLPSRPVTEDALLRMPYLVEIRKAKKNLAHLKTVSAKLRKFLAREFSIEQLA